MPHKVFTASGTVSVGVGAITSVIVTSTTAGSTTIYSGTAAVSANKILILAVSTAAQPSVVWSDPRGLYSSQEYIYVTVVCATVTVVWD